MFKKFGFNVNPVPVELREDIPQLIAGETYEITINQTGTFTISPSIDVRNCRNRKERRKELSQLRRRK